MPRYTGRAPRDGSLLTERPRLTLASGPVERAPDQRLELVLAVAFDHLEHRDAAVRIGRAAGDARDALRLQPVMEQVADRGDGRHLRHPARRHPALAPLPDRLAADAEEATQLGLRELQGLGDRVEQGGG